jgi:Family of unknown function (DUF5938)/Saccharopine dehydrogenase NADP binding domain
MSKPVVVYGASGYTGKLVCEHLRNYNIPFLAAGRSAERVEAQMKLVPGIETADYEVVEVKHDLESLADLMDGAKVMCNTVGPFAKYSKVVVEAALKAGCHYMDTTGEQAFVQDMADAYGDEYAAKGLCLMPSTAYMYTTLDICAQVCKEELPGAHTLDGVLAATAVPTYASTQSFFDILRRKHLYLELNELKEWPEAQGYEVNVPGFHATALGLPWGGTSLPIWYRDDHQIHTCKVIAGFTNRPMMEFVLETWRKYVTEIKHLPEAEQEKTIAEMADQVQFGTPPRENPIVHGTMDSCSGIGSLEVVNVALKGSLPYRQTGMFQAHVTNHLLAGGPILKHGFASACQAIGYRTILGALKTHGYVKDVKVNWVA